MNKVIWFAGFILIGAFAIIGCSKVSDNVDPAVFGGTWNGTVTCVGMDPLPGSITINMDGSTATTEGQVGTDACYKIVTFTGKVYNDHLVFSDQLNTDACGNSSTYSASIYVYQNTLTLSQTITGVSGKTTCSFVGTK